MLDPCGFVAWIFDLGFHACVCMCSILMIGVVLFIRVITMMFWVMLGSLRSRGTLSRTRNGDGGVVLNFWG